MSAFTDQESRSSLSIRQQPHTARVGLGKDRRPIDPPIILQLQLLNFNPNSTSDMEFLRSSSAPPFFVTSTLVSASSPTQDMTSELKGTTVCPPFFYADDPDSERASSPSSCDIIQSSPVKKDRSPCIFFIFDDISVQTPGDYRLQFKLYIVKLDISPFLHSLTSESFTVVHAKKFSGLSSITPLVKGLIEQGAEVRSNKTRGRDKKKLRTKDKGEDRTEYETEGETEYEDEERA